MTFPKEWMLTGAAAMRDENGCGASVPADGDRVNVFCDDPRLSAPASSCACKTGTDAALAALIPLIVGDMMEPSHAVIDRAYAAAECDGLIQGYTDFKVATGAMLRAWARERGVDMGET